MSFFVAQETSFVMSEVPENFGGFLGEIEHFCGHCFVSVRGGSYGPYMLIIWEGDNRAAHYLGVGDSLQERWFPTVEDILEKDTGEVLPATVAGHVAIVTNAYKMGLT